jgi:large subunit ribosomal protein L14e
MGDAEITTSAWRQVEVGRVVLFNEGIYEGRLATIVEIIDHKRVRTFRDLVAGRQLTET